LRGCDAGMNMNVVPMGHLYETIQNLTNSTRWLLACAAAAALLAAAAGVGSTQLIAVTERAPEIGVMRALGASKAEIFKIISMEAALISAIGAIAGVAVAFLFLRVVENALRARLPFAPGQQLLNWNTMIAAACIGGGTLLGVLAAIGPAWRAADLPPILAMRRKEL
jgi:putative ABC transport system permease protein